MSGPPRARRDPATRAETHAREDAPRSRRRHALRWILIAISTAAIATLAIALVIGARSFAWSDLVAFVERMREWRSSPLAMLAMLGAFAAGGLVVFPINLLIAASIVAFGPVVGGLIAFCGSLASAALLHQIGWSFPEHVWTRFAGAHVERLRERVARHGVLALAIVRLLPIAPYSVVSVAAGAAGIARAPYLAGTAIGMIPGIALYALFVERAREVIADPRPLSWAMLAFAVILIAAFALLLRALARRHRARKAKAA